MVKKTPMGPLYAHKHNKKRSRIKEILHRNKRNKEQNIAKIEKAEECGH